MNQNTPATPSGLRETLDRLHTDVAALSASANRSTVMMAIVGFVLVGLFVGYLTFGYRSIAAATQPAQVVLTAQGMIDESLPELRRSLEEEVIRSAPTWVAGLSKQARASMPALRTKLEQLLVESLNKTLREADLLTEKRLQEYCSKHRATLQRVVKDLQNDPKLSDEAFAMLINSLEAELEIDMLAQAKLLVDNLASVNRRLERLRLNKGLTEEEQLERQCVMLARRLQTEQIDPALAQTPISALTSQEDSSSSGGTRRKLGPPATSSTAPGEKTPDQKSKPRN